MERKTPPSEVRSGNLTTPHEAAEAVGGVRAEAGDLRGTPASPAATSDVPAAGILGLAEAPGMTAVQTQIAALRMDLQRMNERMAALQAQAAAAAVEGPQVTARIEAALARLAAMQGRKK